MPNFYFNFENNRRSFYAVTGNNMTIHVALDNERLLIILDKLVSSNITSLSITDSKTEAIFDNTIKVTFNNGIFKYVEDNYNEYLDKIQMKIKKYVEQSQLRKIKDKNLKVNRTRNKEMKKMFITSSLGISLFLGTIITPKVMNKLVSNSIDEQVFDQPIESLDVEDNKVKTDTMIINGESYEIESLDDNIAEDNTAVFTKIQNNYKDYLGVDPININLEYTPISDMWSRYKETDEHWGDIIRYYANRWGLSAELEIAQISRERPNFKNGQCDNICQLTKKYYDGQHFKVPVYDENGFTGTYDEFTSTLDSINTYEGNIMAGLASMRNYIDNYGVIMGLFLYNQGPSSLKLACNYYGVDIQDYMGEENAIKARDLIVKYYKEQGKPHGDPSYLENVIAQLPQDERGGVNVSCYVGKEKVEIAINNTLEYNMNR